MDDAPLVAVGQWWELVGASDPDNCVWTVSCIETVETQFGITSFATFAPGKGTTKNPPAMRLLDGRPAHPKDWIFLVGPKQPKADAPNTPQAPTLSPQELQRCVRAQLSGVDTALLTMIERIRRKPSPFSAAGATSMVQYLRKLLAAEMEVAERRARREAVRKTLTIRKYTIEVLGALCVALQDGWTFAEGSAEEHVFVHNAGLRAQEAEKYLR